MNKLEIHKLHYNHLTQEAEKNNLDWKNNKDLVNLINWLISDLEDFTKREQELFNVENHILWVEYRDYKFKIYLDAERNTLVGAVLREGRLISRGFESNSLNCLIEKLERQVDELNHDRHSNLLAQEIIQLQNKIKELELEIGRLEKEKKSEPMWTYCGD